MFIIYLIFNVLGVISALATISVQNPVHSIFCLILVFINISGLLFILQADFLALLFLLVYIGAIAVLFLFIIMMLNIKTNSRTDTIRYIPLGIFFAFLIIIQIYFIFNSFTTQEHTNTLNEIKNTIISGSNVEIIGSVLYTHHVYHFILAGLILLLAMIGAIVLTLQTSNVKRQQITEQVTRSAKNAIFKTKKKRII